MRHCFRLLRDFKKIFLNYFRLIPIQVLVDDHLLALVHNKQFTVYQDRGREFPEEGKLEINTFLHDD